MVLHPCSPLPWTSRLGDRYEESVSNTMHEVVDANEDTVLDDQTYYPEAVKPEDQVFIVQAANAFHPALELLQKAAEELDQFECSPNGAELGKQIRDFLAQLG